MGKPTHPVSHTHAPTLSLRLNTHTHTRKTHTHTHTRKTHTHTNAMTHVNTLIYIHTESLVSSFSSIHVTCIPVSTLTPGPSTRDSGRWPLTEYTRTAEIQRLESLEVLEGTGQIAGSSGADIAPWVLRDAVGLQVGGVVTLTRINTHTHTHTHTPFTHTETGN